MFWAITVSGDTILSFILRLDTNALLEEVDSCQRLLNEVPCLVNNSKSDVQKRNATSPKSSAIRLMSNQLGVANLLL